tara:strand:- start:6833 stop:7270 length:438 start_codon:yes stop_codon:yes gene_type:complete
MSFDFNKVLIGGRVTHDPELRFLPNNNMAVCTFSMVTNKKFKKADGEYGEETTYVDCESWGKQAETSGKFLKKGKAILAEGRLKMDQWDDKESGKKRTKIMIVVERFTFTENRGEEDEASDPRPQQNKAPQNQPGGSIDEDNLPF